jgi:xanthine dehydrogenase small subunit
MARSAIRFLRRGQIVALDHVPPMQTLLDYLRLEEKSRGTKEGCNEGDCGACTIALGRIKGGRLVYEPVNACICLMGQIDGAELVTVEDLAQGGVFHPVQQAMVDLHASQCGFCTPGFVMALWTLYRQGLAPGRQQIADHIAGNLCRCTGYRPIVDAGIAACAMKPSDQWARDADDTLAKLKTLADGEDVFIGSDDSFLAIPGSPDAAASLAARHPDATLVSGATDVGLWITKQMRNLPKIIHFSRAGMDRIEDGAEVLSIGAGATYADAEAALRRLDPDLGELLRRIGSKQVRASGTIGGNIANGSPIGDMPPALIALGATLHLRHGEAARTLPLEDFFIAYGQQDRKPGELVIRVDIPKPSPQQHFRCYKISKRFDQDISAVMGAFLVNLEGRRIVSLRAAYGGMAATPKRARQAEAALAGVSLDQPASWTAGLQALHGDFTPLSDMRASAAYRMETAQALLHKALLEIAAGTSAASRVMGHREHAA